MTALALAPRAVRAWRRGEAWFLESPMALAEPPARLGDLLRRHAARAPERDFLLERDGDRVRRVTWGAALAAAEAIAGWLVAGDPDGARRPVAALSGASIDHALLMLGCYLAGVPFVPVSAAYSLLSVDFGRLVHITAKVRPRIVFAEARPPFARALAAIAGGGAAVVTGPELRAIARSTPGAGDRAAREAAIAPDDVAKILFTSGSTGYPKGVPNTHRMLCANQQMITQLWPFLDEEPPVLVDWLPWSHTFGGNHNFNLVLFHGGTLFVDQGKPTDALLPVTLRNLRELSPTIYFNVPAGYAALLPHLEADEELARSFFRRLKVIFYAAAALPDESWQRLRHLAERCADHEVFLTTAWGSTETSPLATSAHFELERAGNIGLPAPGVTLKLVPNGNKLEVRVRGPNVMRGYLDEPELTRAAFDEEGFYRIGDAVRFADAWEPSRGLLFDGRVAEDFKLATGTWVNVGALRVGLVGATAPQLLDVVVAGHDREHIGVLVWPRGAIDRAALLAALRRWNDEHVESSMFVARALILEEPPNLDAGEITDKGYVNQRATLERRAALVARLFADPPGDEVLVV